MEVVIYFIVGIAVGFLLRNVNGVVAFTDNFIGVLIYIFLFLLGISVGSNEEVVANFGSIGIKALVLTLGAVIGSVVLSKFIYKFLFDKKGVK